MKYILEKGMLPPTNMNDSDQICGLCWSKFFTSDENSSLTFEQRMEKYASRQQEDQKIKVDIKQKIDERKNELNSKSAQYKLEWDKNSVIQFKNERIAILKRMVGWQVQFIVAFDELTKDGYELKAIDEGQGIGDGVTGGLSAYFYFQKSD